MGVTESCTQLCGRDNEAMNKPGACTMATCGPLAFSAILREKQVIPAVEIVSDFLAL